MHREDGGHRCPRVIPYASRTGTRRNLAALREAGWRLLVSAAGVLRHEGFPYALDNGAWSDFQAGQEFDGERFRRALHLLGADADWIALPDIVGGGLRSLDLSVSWLGEVRAVNDRALLPVQDGMTPETLRPVLSAHRLGIFLGGSTEWKLATIGEWGDLAHELACHYHVARVNTRRRIWLAAMAGAHSIDGTSATKYMETLPMLDQARRQRGLRLTADRALAALLER